MSQAISRLLDIIVIVTKHNWLLEKYEMLSDLAHDIDKTKLLDFYSSANLMQYIIEKSKWKHHQGFAIEVTAELYIQC